MGALTAASPRHPIGATDAGSSGRSAHDERGFSFLEVMISATLMGIAFAAIFSAMSTANLTALRNNQQVQVEAALSTAKQTLSQAAFDPTGVYGSSFPTTINGVVVSLNPSPVAAAPGYTLTTLQAVTIQATLSSTTRTITVYKGNR